ncbi:MAG TPA: hypothetical protein VLL54_02765 [Pyrinomonadaceae bacterium]|nr:hypothetical protein [Pyrinomonadaceae bacterium]
MKRNLFRTLFLLVLALSLSTAMQAQTDATQQANDSKAKATTGGAKDPTPATAITASTTPIDLARAALAAQGGDKYKTMKNMILQGSVDLYAPNSTFSLPGGFVWVEAGEKVRLEVNAPPTVSFKQIYDGQRSYSSLPGVELPPASKFGLPLLGKFDQPGYTVSALPDKKKLRGFRIADAEGNATDFFVDPATGRVMTFLIAYNGFTFGTDNKKFKEVEGVLIPVSFSQRLEMQAGAYFAEYNVKTVKLNQALGDDVFNIPN